ncbi:MAG: hypothetical protein QN198_01440 [Armatimonadota bacterium]|nr:hypothetical protein [Armatimonadota bacterium]MDR5702248.1 hypothetical protein [Armatimonadota bacterium]
MGRAAVKSILARLGLRPEHESWMMLSGLLALCTLAAVAVFVAPLFGSRIATMTAIALVVGIVIACYIICVHRVATCGGLDDLITAQRWLSPRGGQREGKGGTTQRRESG